MDLSVLKRIWGEDDGYVFIPRIQGWKKDPKSGKLRAEKYTEGKGVLPSQAIAFLEGLEYEERQIDVYFCPMKFKTKSRTKEEAFDKLNFLWADLDEAHPDGCPIPPSFSWETSEGHYQAIWELDAYLPTDQIEELNKRMTYACGADKSGWDVTQLLRVPGTINFKREKPYEGSMLKGGLLHAYSPSLIRDALEHVALDEPTLAATVESIESLLEGWKLPKRTLELLRATTAEGEDRSERLWELEKLLVEAGMPVSLIVDVVKATVWNKYADRRDGDKVLLKDVMKAEAEFRLKKTSSDAMVVEGTRKLKAETFADFMDKYIPEPRFLVDGIVQEAGVGVCAGEPKTMKSTIMLDLAISVAAGKPFLGIYRTRPCPVLYIQQENGEGDIKKRVTRISYHRRAFFKTSVGFDREEIPLHIVNNDGINLQEQADREMMDAFIEENGIKLLILDPWYMMCGVLDENSTKEVSPILQYLTSIRNRFKCAVILVHHFKKAETSRPGQRMRGSSVFHAWIESGLYTSLNKGKEGDIILEREFRAFTPLPSLNLLFKSTDDSSLSYDVEVSTVSDRYLAKLAHADEPDDDELEGKKDKDVEEIMTLTPEEVEEVEHRTVARGLSKELLLKRVRSGSFSMDVLCKEFKTSRRKVEGVLEVLASRGFIRLKVPLSKVRTNKDIDVLKGATV